ncbi:MAG: hypothetical protein ACR2IH_10580 [Pyrinomonadaceae bacterium]
MAKLVVGVSMERRNLIVVVTLFCDFFSSHFLSVLSIASSPTSTPVPTTGV